MRSTANSARAVIVMAAVSLVLIACGDGDDAGSKPLAPSSGTGSAQQSRTPTRAEYLAIRDWIVSDGSSETSLRPVCDRLQAGPDTPVIRALRSACDRLLSVLIDTERIKTRLQSECPGDSACKARYLRGPLRQQLVNIKRVTRAYYGDIEAAMKDGPCRDALTPPAGLSRLDAYLKKFDAAVDEFEQGNAAPLQALHLGDDDIDDPTPCSPQ
jgi:hypothetical protein